MISCKICNCNYDDYRKLSKHIRDKHDIKIREYYDTFIKSHNEGICKICGDDTKYINISNGYFETCSKKSCKSVVMKKIRHENSLDKEKHTKFINKVAENQSRIWAKRKESGEDISIREKIGATISAINSTLTRDELKEKFGWLNKLSDEEKEKWKSDVMFNTGAHLFWKTATNEEKKQVVIKRMRTMFENVDIMIENYKNTNEWRIYNSAVRYLTEINYQSNIDKIDPNRQRGDNFHLDHMFSVRAGFLSNISPLIIASPHNLKIITKQDNLEKSARCDITIEDLLEKYNNGK